MPGKVSDRIRERKLGRNLDGTARGGRDKEPPPLRALCEQLASGGVPVEFLPGRNTAYRGLGTARGGGGQESPHTLSASTVPRRREASGRATSLNSSAASDTVRERNRASVEIPNAFCPQAQDDQRTIVKWQQTQGPGL